MSLSKFDWFLGGFLDIPLDFKLFCRSGLWGICFALRNSDYKRILITPYYDI